MVLQGINCKIQALEAILKLGIREHAGQWLMFTKI
jgi:hypothetical protein